MSQRNISFERRLVQVQQFVEENGHGWIPARYDTEPATRLGFWANDMRYYCKHGKLSSTKQAALEAAGFVFDAVGKGPVNNNARLQSPVQQHPAQDASGGN